MKNFVLTAEQKLEIKENGVLVLRGYIDVETWILPIQKAIYEIIGLVIKRHNLNIVRKPFSPCQFDDGYADLIAIDRAFGGEIYDAVKSIPAFLRLISSEQFEKLFLQLRETELAGIGAGSYGIRIDNPNDYLYRSHWHQEFIVQPQSLDGIVMWTPLISITEEIGPVMVCLGSNRDGLRKVTKHGKYTDKKGAYKIGLVDEESVVAEYQCVAPLTEPGDLILMDFLTIHQSGINQSNRSRWSIQTRFFNFHEENGIRIGWKGSVTLGTNIENIFNSYFLEEKSND
ncbi:hypothetical protein MTYM_00907 [Methylococcales bacterium]|nr:hypothetical protein MTYM_00907 [Methylococcales bacterium]